MPNGEVRLVEVKGRHRVIETCHILKSVVELEVEGLRVYPEEVLRGESKVEGDPKVEEDREEVVHREARPPLPEYRVDIVGSRTIPRITVREKFESV